MTGRERKGLGAAKPKRPKGERIVLYVELSADEAAALRKVHEGSKWKDASVAAVVRRLILEAAMRERG